MVDGSADPHPVSLQTASRAFVPGAVGWSFPSSRSPWALGHLNAPQYARAECNVNDVESVNQSSRRRLSVPQCEIAPSGGPSTEYAATVLEAVFDL